MGQLTDATTYLYMTGDLVWYVWQGFITILNYAQSSSAGTSCEVKSASGRSTVLGGDSTQASISRIPRPAMWVVSGLTR